MNVFPWFQPIIEIASGEVAGYEALARTADVQGQIISAANLFSSSSLSREERLSLDRDIRLQALTKFNSLPQGQFLSLNISPEWINSVTATGELPTLEMLKQVGVRPEQVVLEITELDGDLDRICLFAERYRSEGVKIAYDDFGAGFQQMDRVLAFTPDFIKLDMRMFQRGPKTHFHSALMQTVGEMSARLGCKVIFEGVETPDEFFAALHCNASYIQGFIFSPARAEFMGVDSMKAQTMELISQHLDMAIDEVARRQFYTEGLHSELMLLKDLLLSGGTDNLNTWHPDPDVLRFYICNRNGTQISSNFTYDVSQGVWVEDAAYAGHNWSWRPYFYQLLGATDFERRIMSSSPYYDLETGQECSTLSLSLDDARILLVDIREERKSQGRLASLISCHSDLIPALS
ncbi:MULTISPECIES: EAL domain-containing protein [Nitrincola]|uniref:Putative EAL-domain containing protein ykuI n=1 Tax=Nitrincola nitratireducens TaxID=1229521 RepID=W9UW82_9GAMM|nr:MULTISPECIES: EAL domain-containing protein [Nitrincola]EXJ11508.1 putative EAL-domain containing protein ykuI [Nitrincola nitratireducens]